MFGVLLFDIVFFVSFRGVWVGFDCCFVMIVVGVWLSLMLVSEVEKYLGIVVYVILILI